MWSRFLASEFFQCFLNHVDVDAYFYWKLYYYSWLFTGHNEKKGKAGTHIILLPNNVIHMYVTLVFDSVDTWI